MDFVKLNVRQNALYGLLSMRCKLIKRFVCWCFAFLRHAAAGSLAGVFRLQNLQLRLRLLSRLNLLLFQRLLAT